MSENNETIADICGYLQRRAEYLMKTCKAEIALDFLAIKTRIEAAAKREIPQPDPDWKTICEKCKDGEILPDNCEYFGEPNGCNSPLYGQHPKEEHGNAAAMRAALECVKRLFDGRIMFQPAIRKAHKAVEAALSASPRNCDVKYADRVEMYGAFKDWCKAKGRTMEPMLAHDAFDWLLASVTKEGESDGSK